ncbi:MAG: LLM class F420-dependent oxidoreductase [Ilumatobacteraceae bacterium]
MLGLTIPLDGYTLAAHREALRELVDLGFTDVWAGEADGLDAVVPLAAAAAWEPSLRIGTGIVPSFTRGPAVLAMTAAALTELAPGHVSLGIGASSPVVVGNWNGIAHDQPFDRTRDVLRFLRRALRGERISEQFATFEISGFRLGRPPAIAPELLLAALRPRMLRLAATEADGAITTWVGPDHVERIAAELADAAPARVSPRLVAWVSVCPDADADAVRARARPTIAAYLNVPAYEDFHRWLGNEALLEPVWEAWKRGDRRGAVAAVSEELVDQLIVHGPAEHCREVIDRYRAAGVTDIALSVQAGAEDPMHALRALAPR